MKKRREIFNEADVEALRKRAYENRKPLHSSKDPYERRLARLLAKIRKAV